MPEILRKEIGDAALYAVWRISESTSELFGMIRLRPAETSLYSSFVADNRKKQWLAYRILIRSLLLPEDYPVEYDESGKPYLAGSRIHISVTHSGDLAAVILSSRGMAGIDIEAVRPRIERVREKYLHPEELERIKDPQSYGILTLAWCAKEALYKLNGQRGLDFREHIRLRLPDSPEADGFFGEIRYGTISRSFRLSFRKIDDYILVWVLE